MVTQKIAGFTPCPHRKPKTNTQHQDHRQQYPRTRILCRQRQFPGTQRSEKTLSRQQGNWMFLPMIPHHKISLASSIQKTFPTHDFHTGKSEIKVANQLSHYLGFPDRPVPASIYRKHWEYLKGELSLKTARDKGVK